MVVDRLVIVIVILGFHRSEKQRENEVVVHSKITGPPKSTCMVTWQAPDEENCVGPLLVLYLSQPKIDTGHVKLAKTTFCN